jgi:hypothetical protein
VCAVYIDCIVKKFERKEEICVRGSLKYFEFYYYGDRLYCTLYTKKTKIEENSKKNYQAGGTQM